MLAPLGMKLVLASGSPRRRELLAAAGIPFEIRLAPVAEVRRAGEAPAGYVQRLAREKAFAVVANDHEIVLGADTTVVADDLVLEKPRDAQDAERMLALLGGRKHQVLTGICLRQGTRAVVCVETTLVEFSALALQEITAYVATGEPMDKAGAYAIQGIASRWITRIEGCYFNVVGLPVARVWQELQKFQPNGAE
jgi:septum formation protein